MSGSTRRRSSGSSESSTSTFRCGHRRPRTRPKELDTFAAAMAAADGKVLLHCTIAWRASHLWAAYLIRERRVPVTTALEQTRMINLMDDMRMGSGDRQPLEGFLGRVVPEMGHPQMNNLRSKAVNPSRRYSM